MVTILQNLGSAMGSLRYARDILESKGQVLTRPWWHVPRNTWTAQEISEFIDARGDGRGVENFILKWPPKPSK